MKSLILGNTENLRVNINSKCTTYSLDATLIQNLQFDL
jgi:hypothetical protein